MNKFSYALCERNGLNVILDHFKLKIWTRKYENEPPQSFKKREPAIFTGQLAPPVEIERNGCYGNHSRRRTAIFDVDPYRDWLSGDEWVEVTFSGQDENGNPVSVTFQGAD